MRLRGPSNTLLLETWRIKGSTITHTSGFGESHDIHEWLVIVCKPIGEWAVLVLWLYLSIVRRPSVDESLLLWLIASNLLTSRFDLFSKSVASPHDGYFTTSCEYFATHCAQCVRFWCRHTSFEIFILGILGYQSFGYNKALSYSLALHGSDDTGLWRLFRNSAMCLEKITIVCSRIASFVVVHG